MTFSTFFLIHNLNIKNTLQLKWPPVCNKPLVAYLSLAWCLERKIPVGRRPFSQAGRRRSSFSGDEEQSPPPYPAQGRARPWPRTHLHRTHKSGKVTLKIKSVRHCALWGSAVFLTGGTPLSLAHRASLWSWTLLMLQVLLLNLHMLAHVKFLMLEQVWTGIILFFKFAAVTSFGIIHILFSLLSRLWHVYFISYLSISPEAHCACSLH